jgi:cell division transport system permease protein
MWRNKGMGLASVTSITAVLIILGLVFILILSLNNIVVDTKDKFDEIQIFIEDTTEDEQIELIKSKIENQEGVSSVIFQSKDEALEKMKEDWGDEAYLLEGLETNPLPNTIIVKLKDIEYADSIAEKIKDLEGIEEIQYNQDIIEKLVLVANYVKTGGMLVVSILIFISVFIISNTIKLTVTARRREISIMKYVGATNGYIKGPFIIEGVLFGLIGAMLSVVIVYYGYEYFFNAVNDRLYVLFTIYLVPPKVLLKDISTIFVTIGAGIGALGSLVSLKKFLNV